MDKKLRKFKYNAQLIKNYKNFIIEFECVNNPADIETKKHGRYKNCFGKHMTKSHSLIYLINYEKYIAYLLDLDDHKNLYG